MTIPVYVLLAFAGWTLLTLLASVGVYRWSRILTGRARISDWRANVDEGNDFYRRAMRAHLNCVENLPVYTAIVVAMLALGIHHRALDVLSIMIIVARILQTITHLSFQQTDGAAAWRFGFFFLQILAMASMAIMLIVLS